MTWLMGMMDIMNMKIAIIFFNTIYYTMPKLENSQISKKVDHLETIVEKDNKIDKKVDKLKIQEEIVKSEEYDFDLYKFIDNFNILTVTMGTIIAFSLNTVIQELTRDTIVPIVINLLNIRDFIVFGITLNAERIIGNILYLLLVIIIVILIFRFMLKRITGRIIKEKEIAKLIDKEIRYKEIILLEQLDKNVNIINKKLENHY